MPTRKVNPTSPGRRNMSLYDFSNITTDSPEKSLLRPKKRKAGRNNQGRITVRHRGGGHKKKYRIIDFKRDKFGIPAIVKTIEYDPNRTARIALLFYSDGEKRYIIAPKGLQVGDKIMSGKGVPPNNGNTLYLSEIPLGSTIHNIELSPGKGAAFARSAGSGVQLVAREGKYATLRLPSGETRLVLVTCLATIGAVSNSEHILQKSGKAGRSRWFGRRPRTRGVAMNPVDHPMGGGEGKSSGGHPRSRNGVPAKGFKTRKKKKSSNKYIVKRRK